MALSMTDTQARQLVNDCIQDVRAGAFTAVFLNRDKMTRLEILAQRTDPLGVQSRAMLAEIYDQVGMYKRASELANEDFGKAALGALERDIKRGEPRFTVRAHAWLLLQCIVSMFRRGGQQSHTIDLLDRGIEQITTNRGEAVDSQHIHSLFIFWRGRIRMVMYDFSRSDDDFALALSVADHTLREKLEKARQEGTDKNTHVTASSHILATILSFGLAQARQTSGRLRDSQWFLKAAVPLSRGSDDFHRRGFTHMLMGTAIRGLAYRAPDHAPADDLDRADEQLLEARRLFGERNRNGSHEEIPEHPLHLARVYHQMALSKYYRARAPIGFKEDRAPKERELLTEALDLIHRAQARIDHPDYAGFHDAVLDYNVKVTESLLQTALGRFTEAFEAAQRAIDIRESTKLPEEMKGWALVAKGLSFAERVKGRSAHSDIEEAVGNFKDVLNDEHLRATDRAAASLYLSRLYARINDPFHAAVFYDRAQPLVALSEHGWIRELSDASKVSADVGPELTVNLLDLLDASKQKGEAAWPFVTKFVEEELKKRLIKLKQDTLEDQDGPGALAKEIGVTRQTVFNWKKNPELGGLFPTPRGSKKKHRP